MSRKYEKQEAKNFLRKKIRKYVKEKEGATIVEVAVIVPMILIVVMGCIFLLFFLLDMGAVQSESIYIANDVATQWHVSVGTVTVKTTVGFQLAGRQLSFTSNSKAAIDNREQWIRILLHPDT